MGRDFSSPRGVGVSIFKDPTIRQTRTNFKVVSRRSFLNGKPYPLTFKPVYFNDKAQKVNYICVFFFLFF